jgi:hypothetical protein
VLPLPTGATDGVRCFADTSTGSLQRADTGR